MDLVWRADDCCPKSPFDLTRIVLLFRERCVASKVNQHLLCFPLENEFPFKGATGEFESSWVLTF